MPNDTVGLPGKTNSPGHGPLTELTRITLRLISLGYMVYLMVGILRALSEDKAYPFGSLLIGLSVYACLGVIWVVIEPVTGRVAESQERSPVSGWVRGLGAVLGFPAFIAYLVD